MYIHKHTYILVNFKKCYKREYRSFKKYVLKQDEDTDNEFYILHLRSLTTTWKY